MTPELLGLVAEINAENYSHTLEHPEYTIGLHGPLTSKQAGKIGAESIRAAIKNSIGQPFPMSVVAYLENFASQLENYEPLKKEKTNLVAEAMKEVAADQRRRREWH